MVHREREVKQRSTRLVGIRRPRDPVGAHPCASDGVRARIAAEVLFLVDLRSPAKAVPDADACVVASVRRALHK